MGHFLKITFIGLGLDLLHAITTQNLYQLRVDLEDWDGNTAYAIYRLIILSFEVFQIKYLKLSCH